MENYRNKLLELMLFNVIKKTLKGFFRLLRKEFLICDTVVIAQTENKRFWHKVEFSLNV